MNLHSVGSSTFAEIVLQFPSNLPLMMELLHILPAAPPTVLNRSASQYHTR